MLNTMHRRIKICPLCNCEIQGYPAISRKDNKTEICSLCGVLEALHDFLVWNEAHPRKAVN
jgi:hypothetical protein